MLYSKLIFSKLFLIFVFESSFNMSDQVTSILIVLVVVIIILCFIQNIKILSSINEVEVIQKRPVAQEYSRGQPVYRPVRYRGDYHPQQTNTHQHVYYDPETYSPMLNDIIASRIPNHSINQKYLGNNYDYLTNYKYNIVKNHEQFHRRNKIERSWWKN